jgi:hypothetical protein
MSETRRDFSVAENPYRLCALMREINAPNVNADGIINWKKYARVLYNCWWEYPSNSLAPAILPEVRSAN